MATWEDGPEYAPVVRPDSFAAADAPPLPVVPPVEASGPPEPIERPFFDQPGAPVAPLETLIPPLEDVRDPAVPFDIASSTLTEATSAWSAAHWSPPSGPPAATGLAPGFPAPAGLPPAGLATAGLAPVAEAPVSPWPPPDQPFAPPPPSATPVGGFPAPGTVQWFAAPPAPPGPPPPPPSGPAAIVAALTPGVIICLAVGGIVWPLAPVAFGLAFALTSRMRAGEVLTRALFGIASGLLVLVLVLGILLGDGVFGDWWELLSRWAQVLSWVMLVVSWIVVWRDLRSGGPYGDPTRSPWG
jgi:hypothetical protein